MSLIRLMWRFHHVDISQSRKRSSYLCFYSYHKFHPFMLGVYTATYWTVGQEIHKYVPKNGTSGLRFESQPELFLLRGLHVWVLSSTA